MAYTTIDKPSDYFETKLYTGNGGTQSITGLDFQPDWVWIKGRSVVAGHNLHDVVRGVNKQLYTNTTDAEETLTTLVTSFNSDGFSLGNNGNANSNTKTFASWNWKAGTSFTNDASSTSVGSIDSAGSVNTDAGFSIISYTGIGEVGTVAHGLGVTPSMVIIKSRTDVNSEAQHWIVYHKSLGNTNYIWLSRDIATGASALAWNDTSPTSSVISLGNGFTPNNYSSINYIAYCFAEKKGYSKFSSYVGNGNADGTFIYTGFKPAFVMIKATDAVKSWMILDNKRNPAGLSGANTIRYRLSPNTNAATSDNGDGHDFYSNGFKHFGTDTSTNQNGTNYIYMAFAENPFATSTGVPATAR